MTQDFDWKAHYKRVHDRINAYRRRFGYPEVRGISPRGLEKHLKRIDSAGKRDPWADDAQSQRRKRGLKH